MSPFLREISIHPYGHSILFSFYSSCFFIWPPLNLFSPWLLIFSTPPPFVSSLRTVYFKCRNNAGWENVSFFALDRLKHFVIQLTTALLAKMKEGKTDMHTVQNFLHYVVFPVKCTPIMWESLFYKISAQMWNTECSGLPSWCTEVLYVTYLCMCTHMLKSNQQSV